MENINNKKHANPSKKGYFDKGFVLVINNLRPSKEGY